MAAMSGSVLHDDVGIIELLVSLVRIPSHPGVPRQEEAVVLELGAYFRAHGIESQVAEVEDGRPNLIASLSGGKAGPHLLFCGHTDTVPPNEGSSADLFEAVEKDGRLHGRGTVDMKGALAAMAGAMVRLKRAGTLTKGKVSLAAVIDEEMQSFGAEALVREGFRADAAVVGEPTGNRIAVGHKGLEWLEIVFEGRAAHGGTPSAGINAISAACHFVHLIEQELVPMLEERRDPVLGLPVINIGTIHGGDQPSTVAAHCRLRLDRRWVTTESIEQVFEDLEGLLEKVRAAKPGLKTKLARMPEGMATMIHGPVVIDADHRLVRASRQALIDSGQPADPLTVFPAWTDASLLSREGGIPSIIWGPGELDVAHSPEESILREDVLLASDLYARCALHFTGSIR
jgi:acetylornithine deacetylase/succinyl-diaminopimelate desuccinylase